MNTYFLFAVFLRYFVDVFLLMGTDRLCGGRQSIWRCGIGGAVEAAYAAVCLLPGFSFLGSVLWQTLLWSVSCMIAFGIRKGTVYRCAVFWLLQMALEGLSTATTDDRHWTVLLGSGLLFFLFLTLLRRGLQLPQYIPVELCYGDRRIKLTALRDTGNTLCDPVSGQSVIVVGADAAMMLTGLTQHQLSSPVEAVGSMPGLRLIPYKTVGTEGGFMLGLRLKQVRVGAQKGSAVVAFAPQCLSSEGRYQALTGGMLCWEGCDSF